MRQLMGDGRADTLRTHTAVDHNIGTIIDKAIHARKFTAVDLAEVDKDAFVLKDGDQVVHRAFLRDPKMTSHRSCVSFPIAAHGKRMALRRIWKDFPAQQLHNGIKPAEILLHRLSDILLLCHRER